MELTQSRRFHGKECQFPPGLRRLWNLNFGNEIQCGRVVLRLGHRVYPVLSEIHLDGIDVEFDFAVADWVVDLSQ
jgi:hypothetical protein